MHSSDNNPNNYLKSGDTIGLSDIINIISNQKKYVILVPVIVFLFSLIYVTLTDNVYRSETKFIKSETLSPPDSSNFPSLGGLASLSGLGLESSSREEEIALSILNSKKFLYKFIKEQEVIISEINPEIANSQERWRENDSVMEDLYLEFKELINHNKNKQTQIHTLSISWSNANNSAYLANILLAELNSYTRDLAKDRAKRRIEFLVKEQASSSLINSKNIFSRLIESSINENMIANTQTEYSFEVIDPAVPSLYHHSPRRLYISLVSIFIGIFLGIFFALMKEYIDKGSKHL